MSPLIAPSRPLLFPAITRESVRWRTAAPGQVEIEVLLSNDSVERTSPGLLVLETAPLGAFVPFTPAIRVRVGALEPGGRGRIRTAVARSFLPGQGNFLPAMAEALARMPGLSPRFLDLLQHAEWAGNLNVYFDRQPERAVEVHRALGLKVQPGRPVALMVDLPPDRTDYRVEVRTPSPGWSAEVAAMGGAFQFLVVSPPARAGACGRVTVEATRLKDSRTVPVEFSFETVQGPDGSPGSLRA
jgi:hypothetical protein